MQDFQNQFIEEQKKKVVDMKEQVKLEMKEEQEKLKLENKKKKKNITQTIQEDEALKVDND